MISRATPGLPSTLTTGIITKTEGFPKATFISKSNLHSSFSELLFPCPEPVTPDTREKTPLCGVQQGLFSNTVISACPHHIGNYTLQLNPVLNHRSPEELHSLPLAV